MKLILLCTSICFCFLSYAKAQVTQEWASVYNGTNYFDGAADIEIDNDGNVYVTGRTSSLSTQTDFLTIKYNSSGDTLWTRRYNGPGNDVDEPSSIAVDNSGNVYVTGKSRSGSTLDTEDYCTVKYNSAGIEQWVVFYDGPGHKLDNPTAIALDGAGNIYVAGGSRGDPTTDNDICVVKYNPAGNMVWESRYWGNASYGFSDWVNDMVVDDSGNVYVTGFADNLLTFWDFCTIKYDSSGNLKWVSFYAGPNNDITEQANAIAIDNSGNVYVTGPSYGGTSLSDYTTIKYNSSGVEQWVVRYNGADSSASFDIAEDIEVDNEGNVIVAGESSADYAVVKYNSSGVEQWAQRFNAPPNKNDEISALVIDDQNNIYVTGRNAGNNNYYDITTIKYSPAGLEEWLITYDGGNGNDEAAAIVLDASNTDGSLAGASSHDVYVTGFSTGSGTSGDFITIKYSQSTTAINELPGIFPDQYYLLQNFPNPFNPSTTIQFALPIESFTRLEIFNTIGEKVSTLVSETLSAGTYEYEWNAEGLPSGIYFYHISAENYVQTKKLLLMK